MKLIKLDFMFILKSAAKLLYLYIIRVNEQYFSCFLIIINLFF